MEVRFHDTDAEFRAVAEPIYRRDPVAHTIELTLLDSGTVGDDSLLLTVWAHGEPVGAAMQTSPYPLVCNAIPFDAVGTVTAAVATRRPDLSGVRGRRDTAVAFAGAWRTATGATWRVNVEERLYLLGRLRAPGVDGVARQADRRDRPTLVDWVGRFFAEAFGSVHDDGGEEFVETAARVGHRFLIWEVDGAPVSTAMLRKAAAGVARIGPVFTPIGHRGHGYGSAVTAAAADLGSGEGTDDIVLFADLANPVANRIYRRIGFAGVADSVRIDFGAPA